MGWRILQSEQPPSPASMRDPHLAVNVQCSARQRRRGRHQRQPPHLEPRRTLRGGVSAVRARVGWVLAARGTSELVMRATASQLCKPVRGPSQHNWLLLCW